MKARLIAGVILATLSLCMTVLLLSGVRAQTEVESEKLAKFVALMQYIRAQPTPPDVHVSSLGTLDFLDDALTDIYIDGFIAPYTGETAEEVRQRIESVPEENRYTAALVESYRLASSPVLLDILHDLLARYYVELFTTSDLSGALDFLGESEIESLTDGFDSSDYAIPRPSVTGTMPVPQPSLTLKYDPDGVDRDCSDFTTWEEAQAFFLATENDSHGLDQDGDKLACEDLPGAPVPVEPTPTFPTTIIAGTHEVGKDISAGLYRGIVPDTRFSSCTWKRWRKNGDHQYEAELDIYFDDDYQFYVRVLETDFSLETNCQLTRIADFSRPPASDLSNTIEPGMYLVGVEIKSGIYEGTVPAENLSSCSWGRHADFTGAFGETIDTGFHSDEGVSFNVLVSPSDYGIATSCRLTFVQ